MKSYDGKETLCNKCGKSCVGSIGNHNGLIEAKIEGAFDSDHLEDGTEYTFSLCEKCLKELFDTFLHKPHERDYLFGEEDENCDCVECKRKKLKDDNRYLAEELTYRW